MGHKNEAAGTEKDRAANGSKNKWRTALKVSSVLLLILCFVELVLCALSAMGLYAMFSDEVLAGLLSEDGVDEGSLVLVLSVSLAIMVAESVLQAIAFAFGMRALKGKSRAESCQVIGILLVGAAVVSAMATGITSGFNSATALSLVISLILPLVYYVSAHRIAKDTFWKGIKKAPPNRAAPFPRAANVFLKRLLRLYVALLCLTGGCELQTLNRIAIRFRLSGS